MGNSIKKAFQSASAKIVGFTMAMLFAVPQLAVAAEQFTNPMADGANVTDTEGLAGIVNTALPYIFGIAVVVAVVVIIWQGLKMVGGNPQAAEQAKGTIIRVLIGLAVVIFATVIINVATGALIDIMA